jgi:hypothetical protein
MEPRRRDEMQLSANEEGGNRLSDGAPGQRTIPGNGRLGGITEPAGVRPVGEPDQDELLGAGQAADLPGEVEKGVAQGIQAAKE